MYRYVESTRTWLWRVLSRESQLTWRYGLSAFLNVLGCTSSGGTTWQTRILLNMR